MRDFAVAFASFCLATSSAQAQTATKQPDVRRMELIIQESVKQNHFMGTVLVDRGPDMILDKAHGSADLEWNVPNTPDTKFRLGSITKQFTAAGILLLEERGKLKLDDPISKYMPDAPAAWKNITFFHLLTHNCLPNAKKLPCRSRLCRATSVSTSWRRTSPSRLPSREII